MSKLVLYSDFGQEIITYSNAGGNTLRVIESIDPETIFLLGFNAEGAMVPMNYSYRQMDDIFKIGDEVIVSDKVGPYNKSLRGKLRVVTADYVDVEICNKEITRTYRVNKYKQIAVCKCHQEPKILFQANDCLRYFQLSYIFNNIFWETQYTLMLSADDSNKLDVIQAMAQIKNNTHKDLTADTLVLMAGKPKKAETGLRLQSNALMASPSPMQSSTNTKKMSVQDADEYTAFTIENPCVIKDYATVELFNLTNIHAARIYKHNLDSYDQVVFGFRMKAPRFFPQGNAHLYIRDSCNGGIDSYLGSSHVKETQADTELEIFIGKTSRLQVKSEIEKTQQEINIRTNNADNVNNNMYNADNVNSIERLENNQINRMFTRNQTIENVENIENVDSIESIINVSSQIINKTKQKAIIECKLYIGDNKIESSRPKITKLENNNAIWQLEILPATEITFKAQLVLSE